MSPHEYAAALAGLAADLAAGTLTPEEHEADFAELRQAFLAEHDGDGWSQIVRDARRLVGAR